MRRLMSIVVVVAANAVGLIVAALILDGMTLSGLAFVTALLIFTVVEACAEPLIRRVAERRARAMIGVVALIATLLALVVTDLISDGLGMTGFWTWLWATLIVWAASLLAGLILRPILLDDDVEGGKRPARAA